MASGNQPWAARRRATSGSGSNKQEVLRWAALQRLPTVACARRSLLRLMPGSGGGRNHLPSQWGRRTRGAQWRAPHAQLLECRAGGEGKYSCTGSDPVSLMAGDRGRGRTHCRTWSSLIRRATGWETTSYFLCHSVRSQYAGTHRTWGCCREAAVASATFGKWPNASWRNKLMDVDGEVDNARASATCGHGLLRRREVEDAAPPLLSDAPCFVTGK